MMRDSTVFSRSHIALASLSFPADTSDLIVSMKRGSALAAVLIREERSTKMYTARMDMTNSIAMMATPLHPPLTIISQIV